MIDPRLSMSIVFLLTVFGLVCILIDGVSENKTKR